jgi:hypothetical protein
MCTLAHPLWPQCNHNVFGVVWCTCMCVQCCYMLLHFAGTQPHAVALCVHENHSVVACVASMFRVVAVDVHCVNNDVIMLPRCVQVVLTL